jgi:hypothetical protein
MTSVLATELLFDAVQAEFTADESTVQFAWGQKEVAKQINQGPGGANRIVFVTGDESSNIGKIGAPDKPGRNPRPLYTLDELFTVHLWAVDGSALNVERAQESAARKLLDKWLRAIYLATHTDGDTGLGPVAFVSLKWNRNKIERPYGAAIICVATIGAPILDIADDQTTESDHVGFRGPLVELGETQMLITPAP